jgi:hypothetical protein
MASSYSVQSEGDPVTNLYGGAPWGAGALGGGRKTAAGGAGAGAGAESGLDWKESMPWWWKEEPPWWRPIPMPMLESAAMSQNIGESKP